MNTKLQRISNNFINTFLVFLISIAVLGSVAEILPYFNEIGSTGIYLIDLLLIVLLICILCRKKLKILIPKIILFTQSHTKVVVSIFFILIVIWQIFVVFSINGKTMWDANMILSGIVNSPQMDQVNNEYLSVYPNNVLLFVYERYVWLLLSKSNLETLTLTLSLVNILLVDGAIILAASSVKRLFNQTTSAIFKILSLLLMGLSPWLAVPYSDIWAFFFSSLAVYLSIQLFYAQSWFQKIWPAILLGGIITASYYMKPSLIIFYIACFIVGIVATLSKKKVISLTSSFAILFTLIILILGFSHYQKNASYMSLDNNRAMSMMHFAAMGAINKGAYNPVDYHADKAIKNPQKRNARDVAAFKRRIKGYKNVGNYQRFLVRKHVLNTADGTFNWSGNGIKVLFNRRTNNLPQKLYTTQKLDFRTHTIFSFPVQITWTIALVLILFTLADARLFTQILKYTIVGFFAFLLLFEGGKSRYMIQLLPFLLVLASIGGNWLLVKLRQFPTKNLE